MLLTLISSMLMIAVPIIPISASPGSNIYWVEAGAVGDGTSETTPAGNITYALTTYALLTGDVIKVKPGTYDIAAGETFPITLCVSGITLESTDGAETTIIDAGGSDICIKIAADTVTVSGFTVKNAKGGINFDSSVNKCTINGNIICDISDDGIRIFGASNNKIVNNKILNIADLGIYLTAGANNTISANNISTGGFAAVELWGARELAKNNLFENNVIENNNIGIILFGGSENKIIGNVIKDSTKYHGIHLQDTYGNIIENNTITSNAEQGIRFVGASNNKILRNIIKSNKIGLCLKDYKYGNSTGNEVHYNNILDNSKCGINNTAVETVDARFNWWGDASGPTHSSNVDGIGDVISDYVDYSPWLGGSFEVTPRTYHVNPTGTIQEAIDEASPGDTIIVHVGTYAGAVIDKDVTILGAPGGAPIITSGVPYKVGRALYTAFRLDANADGAEIRHFTINCNSSENFYFAIFSRNADNVTVDSLAINDAVQGITNWGGSNWQITNNVLNDTEAAGGGGIAIFLGVYPPGYTVCSGNLIQNNTITATATAPDYTCPGIGLGVDLRWGAYDYLTGNEDMSNNRILNNNITAPGALNGVGIEMGVIGLKGNTTKIAAVLGTIHDNTIRDNTIEGADMGIYFYTVTDLTIQQNEIRNCNEGIHIKDGSDGNTIKYNNIFGNTIGLNMCARAQVYSNTIEGGRAGIWLGPGPYSTSTTVKGNTITDFVKAGIVSRGSTDFIIEGNTISTTLHDEAPNGIDIGIYTGAVGTVRENEISGCSWKDFTGDYETSWSGSGILVIESGDSLEITRNIVYDCDVGMDIESDSMNITCNYVHSNIYGFVFWNAKPGVNYNNIYDNIMYGVYRTPSGDLTGTLDAEYNWWGDASGPYHNVTNTGGLGDRVSDLVDYDPWLDGSIPADVAVISITPSRPMACEGQILDIYVTVKNEGNVTVTFNVTLYYYDPWVDYNETITTQAVTDLAPGANITLTFSWDTTGLPPCINYTIWAEASTLPCEVQTANNILINGKVKINITGDINGDGCVDMGDISIVIDAFLSEPGHPLWKPEADLDNDYVIDMADIAIIISTFLKTCP